MGGHQTVGVDRHQTREDHAQQHTARDHPLGGGLHGVGFLLPQHGLESAVLLLHLLLRGSEVPQTQNAHEQGTGHEIAGLQGGHQRVSGLTAVAGFNDRARQEGHAHHEQNTDDRYQQAPHNEEQAPLLVAFFLFADRVV